MINTKIPWTTHTWNPWVGCRKVSAGCQNCYMFREQRRFGNDPTVVRRASPKTFNAPLSKKMMENPGTVFTCSWSDFFIEEADAWRDEAWEVISRTPEHMYLMLTKRPERMYGRIPCDEDSLTNVAFGITAENQNMFDSRVEIAKEALWNKHPDNFFVSAEPMLGPIDMGEWITEIDWVIVGGESGPNARPVHPNWIRSIRDQCQESGTPFFFKQWGDKFWPYTELPDGSRSYATTKKAKGRLLDGREWDEFPDWGSPNR